MAQPIGTLYLLRRNRGDSAAPYKKSSPQKRAAVSQEKHADQGCRVYVNNLDWDVSWQDLKDHMKAVGKVTRADVMTSANGRSRGCGIVEFSSPSEAAAAIRQLNDSQLKGRAILVREDREPTRSLPPHAGGAAPPAAASSSGGHSRGGGGGAPATGRSVYVGNLPWNTAWQDLKDHMKTAGAVAHVDILMRRDGKASGGAIVQYESARDAGNAIARLNDSMFGGRPLQVREDREAGAGGVNQPPPSVGLVGGGLNVSMAAGGRAGEVEVRIFNLPAGVSWKDLKDEFNKVAPVAFADVVSPSGRPEGIVRYRDAYAADQAVVMYDQAMFNGQPVSVVRV